MKNSIVNRDQIIHDIQWILENKSWELSDSRWYKKYSLKDFRIDDTLIPEFFEFNRLGKYYELLMGFILRTNGVEVLEKNLPVINDGQTIGEFDFLINKNEGVGQLEVAIKYYLEHEDEWIGPNANDKWSIKKNKMESHQLQLKSDFEIESRYYWVQGVLFYSDVNLLGEKDVWLYSDDLKEVIEGGDLFYIDKIQWISGYGKQKVVDIDKEIRLVEEQKKARQYVLLFEAKNIESRIMVVPNLWPRN